MLPPTPEPNDPTRAEGTFVGAGSIEDALETKEAPLPQVTESDLARVEDRVETADGVPLFPGGVDPDVETVAGTFAARGPRPIRSGGGPTQTTPFHTVLPVPGQPLPNQPLPVETVEPPGPPPAVSTEPFSAVLPIPSRAAPTELGPGVTVEGVKVGARLRQDVLGTVFTAEHASLGTCEVLALSEAAAPLLGAQFMLEARLRTTLDPEDARLPFVLALGSNPVPWVATRPTTGTSLNDLLEGDLPRLATLAHDLAGALAKIHARRLFHGDLTPADVRVVEGRVRVHGFGRVVRLDPQGLRRPFLGGPSSGDAAFLAPEVAAGDPPDGAADIYAVGAMLWTGLTGHPPFTGTPVEIRLALNQGALVAPDPLPTQGLEAALLEVATRCLARRPQERYRDAQTLEAALREALELHAASRVRSSWVKWAVLALIAAGAAVAAVAAVVGSGVLG